MITIKSKRELQGMQKSGRVLAAMFEGLRDVINLEFLLGKLKNLHRIL